MGMPGDVLTVSDFFLGLQNWTIQGAGWSQQGLFLEGESLAAMDSSQVTNGIWYFASPSTFLPGDMTLAYNGWLTYNLGHYEYESMGLPPMPAYDVQLVSSKKKFTMGIKGVFSEDPTYLSHLYNVRLDETFTSRNGSQWEMVNVKLPRDGKLVSRNPTKHEFIKCLQTMTGIWIRGSYFPGNEATWLRNVSIIEGSLNKGGETSQVQTLI
ncbi:hypothetical protein GUITHDRAFT_150697, partial [Guillardia theta CCMP2712]